MLLLSAIFDSGDVYVLDSDMEDESSRARASVVFWYYSVPSGADLSAAARLKFVI